MSASPRKRLNPDRAECRLCSKKRHSPDRLRLIAPRSLLNDLTSMLHREDVCIKVGDPVPEEEQHEPTDDFPGLLRAVYLIAHYIGNVITVAIATANTAHVANVMAE